MINTKNLEKEKEYYFYFANYFCTGFVILVSDNTLHLRRGNFYYPHKPDYPYEEAFLDVNFIIGYAST